MNKILILVGLLFSAYPLWAQNKPEYKDTIGIGLQNLSTIEIRGTINKFYQDSSSIAGKLPMRNLENPQVYTSISKQLMLNQVVTQYHEAMKNATGVTRLWESTGRGGDGAEFYTMRGFSVQPSIVNGVPGITNSTIDPANVESIEVIKGPSATLFGSTTSSYGGLISTQTKRAHSTLQGNLGYVGGSFNQSRLTADINIPVNHQLAVRVNTALHRTNSFQDAGFNKGTLLATAIRYKANEKLNFEILASIQNNESANAPMIFLSRYAPLSFDNIQIFEANYKKSYTSNDLSMRNPTQLIQSFMNYEINPNWKSQTIYSSSNTQSQGYYHYLWDLSNGDEFIRYISKRDGSTQTQDFQQNFIGQHHKNKWSNKTIIGLDYLTTAIQNSSSGWVSNGIVSLSRQSDTGKLTQIGVDSLLTNSFEGVSTAKNEVRSVYFSNALTFNKRITAMVSLRGDQFMGRTNYWSSDEIEKQNTVSPKMGIVYQMVQTPKNEVALFANYMNGFVNKAPIMITDADGSNPRVKTLKPEYANQTEIGIKSELLSQRIAITASYYAIRVANKVMPSPNNINDVIQDGTVESKGYEMSIIANPLRGLQLVAGYSNNQAKVTQDDPNNGYLGLRPEEAGPSTLTHFWASYSVPQGNLKGWGFGLGGNTASHHLTLNRHETGTFALPSYQILNASVQYLASHYQVVFKVNNILNSTYYSGWSGANPQVLRNCSLSLQYQF